MQKSKIQFGKYWKLGIYVVPAILIVTGILFSAKISAEQSGSSPDSGSTSRIKTTYDSLVSLNAGSESSGSWGDWGSIWNRIRSAGEWVPDGNATVGDVVAGKTFYSGNSRTVKTGAAVTPFAQQALQGYENQIPVDVVWTFVPYGGNVASVTDNGVTKALASNKVYQDPVTKRYWTDASSTTMDNEFEYVSGDDRVNPQYTSCNLNSPGTANQYCDNRDPTNSFVEDNDVSAAEFCLNLELDGDNLDGDNDSTTGVETDWRLPTLIELMQAHLDNGAMYLASVLTSSATHTATEYYGGPALITRYTFKTFSAIATTSKGEALKVVCIR